jgi:spore cortex formation protein SpoVR/YcgB (stage V sporulation)
MIQNETGKCKEDIVYFAEKYLGVELLDWQRELLEYCQDNKQVYFAGVRSGRNIAHEIIREHQILFGGRGEWN